MGYILRDRECDIVYFNRHHNYDTAAGFIGAILFLFGDGNNAFAHTG